MLGRFEGGPEPQKGSKGKGKDGPVTGGDARFVENDFPIMEHPLPVFMPVEPDEGLPGGATGATKPGVAIRRIGQICAVGWAGSLINGELVFGCKWTTMEEGFKGIQIAVHSTVSKFGLLKKIALQHNSEKFPEMMKLGLFDGLGVCHRGESLSVLPERWQKAAVLVRFS